MAGVTLTMHSLAKLVGVDGVRNGYNTTMTGEIVGQLMVYLQRQRHKDDDSRTS